MRILRLIICELQLKKSLASNPSAAIHRALRTWPSRRVTAFLSLGATVPYYNGPIFPVLTTPEYSSLDLAIKARKAHAVGKWLWGQSNFPQLVERFRKLHRRMTSDPLANPNDVLKFIDTIVIGVDFTFRKTTSTGSSRRTRLSAVAHAKHLLEDLEEGVGEGRAWNDGMVLELRRLVNDPEFLSRKRYAGSRMVGARELAFFAFLLLGRFDIDSPLFVEDFAELIGIERERKACAKYVDQARERWRDLQSCRSQYRAI